MEYFMLLANMEKSVLTDFAEAKNCQIKIHPSEKKLIVW